DLFQVSEGRGAAEYVDPVEFFRRTYLTEGLRTLLSQAVGRLVGDGGVPVVDLQTNFGGGKTHSMLALYHLFGGSKSSSLPGVEAVLAEAGVATAPAARRAVLVGTDLSPGQVHTKPDGTTIRTMWGELAYQLGGKEGYALVADSDRRATSPGSDVLAELFRRHAPVLVLIDEWVAYARQCVGKNDIPAGNFDTQASFAQALTEAAKRAPRTLVVASIPASRIEVGGQNGEHALEALKNVFERVGKAWRPASADEGFEIVRR
ncbi:MAG: ATP-binding protein, partial [Caldilineaceae bacterium]|nr:ATP-binding protein [Caldilineaceae bacterium]